MSADAKIEDSSTKSSPLLGNPRDKEGPKPSASLWCGLFQNPCRSFTSRQGWLGAGAIFAAATPWVALAIETNANAAAYKAACQWSGFKAPHPYGFTNPLVSIGVGIGAVIVFAAVWSLIQKGRSASMDQAASGASSLKAE